MTDYFENASNPVSADEALATARRVSSSGKPIIELSYSGLNNLDNCPRRYQLLKRFAHPAYTWDTGLPAVGGSAIHAYLQARAIGASEVDATYEFFRAYDFKVESDASDWNLKFRAYEDCYASAVAADRALAIQPEEVARLLVNGEERPAIEMKFNMVITSPELANDYHFRGAIDLVRYQSFGNRYRAADFKTQRSTQEADETVDRTPAHKYDDQLIPYGLVIAALQANKGGETTFNGNELFQKIPTFETTYYSIYVDISDSFVKEYTFTRDANDVRDWFDKMVRTIYNIESYHDREIWPRTRNGCIFWNTPCRFFKNCEIADSEVMQNLLLGQHEPAPAKPFGEWVTINLAI